MNRRRPILLASLAAALALAVGLGIALVDDDSAPERAEERCEPGDLRCYEERYARLVEADGPEQAGRVFRADYDRDPLVRAACHRLVHAIGRAAAERFGDLGEAYRHGDPFCGSGYYHGVSEAIVGDPARSRSLERPGEVCTGLGRRSIDEANCSHGLGHGFMAVRDNDVGPSLRLCDRLTTGYERGHCYDGVFMQNVMAHDDPRRPSGQLDPNRPLRLCSAFAARYRTSCLNRQVLYALEVTGADFRAIFGLCRRLEDDVRPQCDRQLGEAAADLNVMSQPNVGVQTGATAQICGLAPGAGARRRCVEAAAAYFVFHYDRTAEADAFCQVVGSLRPPCDRAVRRAAARQPSGAS